MRITGGKFRGIPLKAPGGKRTRPTSDKIRQALFNVLGGSVIDAKTLDLFAGSGALALEALSRGAQSAVLVEKDTLAARALSANIERIGLSKTTRVFRADFRSALSKLSREGERFDIIFIDPPYEGDLLSEASVALRENSVTTKDSIIVVEHFAKTTPPETIAGLPLDNTRAYGQTSLSYYFRDEISGRD
jgi:16S rRNA (guanine(966)-N(2))-methyltransferase RsmD